MPGEVFEGNLKNPSQPDEGNWEGQNPADDVPELEDLEEENPEEENPMENVQPQIEGQQPDVVEQEFQIYPNQQEQQANFVLAMEMVNLGNPDALLFFNPMYFPDFPGVGLPQQDLIQANQHLLRGRGRAGRVARGRAFRNRGRGRATPARGRGRAALVAQGSESPSRGHGRAGPVAQVSTSPTRGRGRAGSVAQESASPTRGRGRAGSVAQVITSPTRGRGRAGSVEQGSASPTRGRGRAALMAQGHSGGACGITEQQGVGRGQNIDSNVFRGTGGDENENEPQEIEKDLQEDFENQNF